MDIVLQTERIGHDEDEDITDNTDNIDLHTVTVSNTIITIAPLRQSSQDPCILIHY